MILEVTSMVAAEEVKGLMEEGAVVNQREMLVTARLAGGVGEPLDRIVEGRPHDVRDAGDVEAWQPARAIVGQAPDAGQHSPRNSKED